MDPGNARDAWRALEAADEMIEHPLEFRDAASPGRSFEAHR
jgi:hypothetical protein